MQSISLKTICPAIVGLMVSFGCAMEAPKDGANAEPCTAVTDLDGNIVLSCPNSEPVTIRNGMDGAAGTPGAAGEAGEDADPCTVTDHNNGTVTIDCPDGTSVTYSIPFCGNGEVEAGEECDDANDIDTDSCLSSCKDATCGDGFIGPEEYCDSNLLGDFRCDANCGGFMCAADFELTEDEAVAQLDGCSQVIGSLSIISTTLENLSGLERLDTVTENLVIKDNGALVNLDALINVTTVDNELEIENNAVLTTIGGLNNVQGVDYLTVKNNPAVPTCEAEALREQLGLDTLEGTVIYGNDDLATCE